MLSGTLTYKFPFLQHSGNNGATIDDLVHGGIPRLSARDICRAMSEIIQRRSMPLFILWDIENISIPTSASAAHVVSQIRDAVAPYGQEKVFHAYASVSSGQITEEKRSELHLSGCNLVDSPHMGRKEVADKMIIVDAMEFAYTHADGATLCFITADLDYAYLLSKLQKPQWKTIVISKGNRGSMLRANCDVHMRWETDILHQEVEKSQFEQRKEETSNVVCSSLSTEPTTTPSLWASNVEMLESIIMSEREKDCSLGVLKSRVGMILKQRHPEIFIERNNIKDFLAQAIEMGDVFESGDGEFKTLYLSQSDSKKDMLEIKVSKISPLSVEEMPKKAIQVAEEGRKHIIFVKKTHFAKEDPLSGMYVCSTDHHKLLMFFTFKDAKSFATERPWLCQHGVLVNWLTCSKPKHFQHSAIVRNEVIKCALCNCMTANDEVCHSCFEGWSDFKRMRAQDKVISLLKVMEDCDDLFIPRTEFAKILMEGYPLLYAS